MAAVTGVQTPDTCLSGGRCNDPNNSIKFNGKTAFSGMRVKKQRRQDTLTLCSPSRFIAAKIKWDILCREILFFITLHSKKGVFATKPIGLNLFISVQVQPCAFSIRIIAK